MPSKAFQLDPFGVDQKEPQILGRVSEKKAAQNGIDADAFTGPRRAGDEQVRHSAEIGHGRLAGYVFPQGYRERGDGEGENL